MTFDDRGRVWITESLEYPRKDAGKGRDRVKVLEDSNGDGKADRFKVFADGLNIPTGIAVGYGGRQEVIDAFRSLLSEQAARGTTLAELAETITTDDIARHLYTAGQPDPDLVIRTSGEQRLSNFLLWQSAYSELYFCEAYWPAFREIDFLRALRSFAARQRRYGR